MIKGLTDNVPAFPRLGVLRKGAPKPQNGPGKDLTYFRFDTDDAAAADAFGAVYGTEPTSINVRLPYATTAANFSAWRELWAGGGLRHRCDGETMVRWQTASGTFSDEPKDCTGGCTPVGRLMVIIPELRRFAYVTVLTSSIHDIMTLQENLAAAELIRPDLTGIPFVLSRRPREISTPRGDKRVRATKSLLSIEPAPAWVGYQLAAMERAAFTGGSYHVLTDGGIVDVDSGEIVEGEIEEEPRRIANPPTHRVLTKTPDQRRIDTKVWLAAVLTQASAKGLETGDAEMALQNDDCTVDQMSRIGDELEAMLNETAEFVPAVEGETWRHNE